MDQSVTFGTRYIMVVERATSNTRLSVLRIVEKGIRDTLQVTLAVHVALAHYAAVHRHCVDGQVHLGMRCTKKHAFHM